MSNDFSTTKASHRDDHFTNYQLLKYKNYIWNLNINSNRVMYDPDQKPELIRLEQRIYMLIIALGKNSNKEQRKNIAIQLKNNLQRSKQLQIYLQREQLKMQQKQYYGLFIQAQSKKIKKQQELEKMKQKRKIEQDRFTKLEKDLDQMLNMKEKIHQLKESINFEKQMQNQKAAFNQFKQEKEKNFNSQEQCIQLIKRQKQKLVQNQKDDIQQLKRQINSNDQDIKKVKKQVQELEMKKYKCQEELKQLDQEKIKRKTIQYVSGRKTNTERSSLPSKLSTLRKSQPQTKISVNSLKDITQSGSKKMRKQIHTINGKDSSKNLLAFAPFILAEIVVGLWLIFQ